MPQYRVINAFVGPRKQKYEKDTLIELRKEDVIKYRHRYKAELVLVEEPKEPEPKRMKRKNELQDDDSSVTYNTDQAGPENRVLVSHCYYEPNYGQADGFLDFNEEETKRENNQLKEKIARLEFNLQQEKISGIKKDKEIERLRYQLDDLALNNPKRNWFHFWMWEYLGQKGCSKKDLNAISWFVQQVSDYEHEKWLHERYKTIENYIANILENKYSMEFVFQHRIKGF